MPPDDARARALYLDYMRDEVLAGSEPPPQEAELPAGLAPPGGALLLVSIDGEPVAIGGIRDLDTDVAEVKSMYVAPAGRGSGLAKRLLGRLEEIAAEHGCRAVRLDTAAHLTAAIALYRGAGYRETPRYNDNPHAAVWFECALEVVEEVATDDPRAVELFRAHTQAGAVALGLPDPEPTAVSATLGPPDGALLLVTLAGEPVAIGGVRDLAGPAAEIKSMYVAPPVRGRGIARRLLARLEEIAAARGCSATRLDTLAKLAPACALYEAAGYERIADYNQSPHADRWYERRLD